MKPIKILLPLLCLIMISGCAQSIYHNTKVVNVQPNREAQANPPYKAPVVGVLIKNKARGQLENALVNALRAKNVHARSALKVFGNKGIKGKSRAYLAKKISSKGFDSAIGIHLVQKKIQNVKFSNVGTGTPPGGAGLAMTPESMGPNFSVQEKTYVAHINFWDIKKQAIVWSATSVTTNPKGLIKGSRQFAHSLVKQMEQAGLFK